MTARSQRRRKRQAGNAMVEFAVAVAFLLPLLLGTFRFGYAFYTYNRLIAAIREGGRYASLRTYDSASATPSSTYLTTVKNAVVYGNPSGGTTPVVMGLNTGQVSVTMTMANAVPNYVTVALTNFDIDAAVTTFHLANKPAATFRFEGRFAPP